MELLNKLTEELLRLRRRLGGWNRVILSLAMVVVFVTTYALILPALTLDEKEAAEQPGLTVKEAEGEVSEDGISSEGMAAERQEAAGSSEMSYLKPGPAQDAAENEAPALTPREPEPVAQAPGRTDSREASEAAADGVDPDDEVSDEAARAEEIPGGLPNASDDSLPVEAPGAAARAEETHGGLPNASDIIQPVDASDAAARAEETPDGLPNASNDSPPVDGPEEEEPAMTFSGEGGTLRALVEGPDGDSEITVSYGPLARIPEGAELTAVEILPTSPAYEEYLSLAKEAVNPDADRDAELAYARFFDISIRCHGKEVEPAAPVDVRIRLLDGAASAEDVTFNALHFTQEGTEKLETHISEDISFLADGFSVYGFTCDRRG